MYAAYGSANAYSTAIYYKVPTSSKYYSMPMSFLVSIGISWHMWHMGVQMFIVWQFLTKCQLVQNIFVGECQLLFCGIFFYAMSHTFKYFTTLRNFLVFFGIFLHMQRWGVSTLILQRIFIQYQIVSNISQFLSMPLPFFILIIY